MVSGETPAPSRGPVDAFRGWSGHRALLRVRERRLRISRPSLSRGSAAGTGRPLRNGGRIRPVPANVPGPADVVLRSESPPSGRGETQK
ncbi:hypothetical protein Nans01_19310 [Nocardiopsis ansamitocini]|uniref:Uncharacterized protein n=1 Tax=Nocardiopsis ansamitocini TaxID=1670832 RepID=A0A9W6P5I6_9ACTN|nr:hypothetical protein Nans01_19310 [Nocardiopsis ansamitocini]